MVLFPYLLNVIPSAPSLTWYFKIFSSHHIFPDQYNFKLLTNCSSHHFANTHQRLHLRQNIFCNQSLQYTAVLDCMKALIAKLYFAAKQFCLFLGFFFLYFSFSGTWKLMCVNKVLWTKTHIKIPFCPCSRLDNCLQLHNSILWAKTVLKGLSRTERGQ